MASHASVAASVRAKKELHPELFCANAKCLWQIVTPRGPNPCRNHPVASPPSNVIGAVVRVEPLAREIQ